MVWLLFNCAIYEKFDPQDGSVGKFCGTFERQSQTKSSGHLGTLQKWVSHASLSLCPQS